MLKAQKMLKSTLAIISAVAIILPTSAQICAEDDPLGLQVRVDGALSVLNSGHLLLPAIKFASPPGTGEKVTVWDPDDEFVGNGADTAFTLSDTYVNTPEVYVAGILQTTGYSIAGSTLTFTTAAPADGAVITVLVPDDEFDGNGADTAFTLSAAPSNSPEVYVDGNLQASGYENLFGIQFTSAPADGAVITVWDPEDEFDADGSETAFTLSATYVNTPHVWVDDTVQTSGYTIAGSTLTFTTAPADGSVITVFDPDDEFTGDASEAVFICTGEYYYTPVVYVGDTVHVAGDTYQMGYAGIEFTSAPDDAAVITVIVPDDEFTANGAKTAFTLSATYGNTPEVYVAGIRQTTGYTIADSTLTFTTAPAFFAVITVFDHDEFTGDASEDVFICTAEYENTPVVYVGDTLHVAGDTYQMGYAGIEFTSAPADGAVITVIVPDDELVGDGTETAFTLSATYVNTPEVYVAGIFQPTGYSIAGSTLTFTGTAPADGAAITVFDPDDEFNGDGLRFNFMMSCPSAICEADKRVSSFSCVACPAGTTRPSGDDASGADTTCDATLCAVNEYVQGNTCKACPAGTTNAKDDDASGIDTSCDGDVVVVSSASQNTKIYALIAFCAAFATYF